jgi:hypothetical protein
VSPATLPEQSRSAAAPDNDPRRYAAWFHELDAWTEYWDIYHPETRGRFYFGDGVSEAGLLNLFLPRDRRPPAFVAWTQMALATGSAEAFAAAVRVPEVTQAVLEVDSLLTRLFSKHFGDASDPVICSDYIEAIFRFATDSLPPAAERDARIADDDPRKSTAGRHTLDGDLMWFCWSLHTEAAYLAGGPDARRRLMLAGVAMGCPVNFAWRGHRRTRAEYRADANTASLLRSRGLQWAGDFTAAQAEIHALYRIREWGTED